MRFSPRPLFAAALFLGAALPSAKAQAPATPQAPAAARPPGFGGPILENGNFDDPTNPLKGWNVDYEWTGNSNYVNNKKFVTIVNGGARKNVVHFESAGEGGVKMESNPIPLEPGFKYTCTFDAKGSAYRVYFAGYKWTPGIRPHDNPQLSELRMIYQSRAVVETNPDWKKEKIELPGVALSPQAIENLRQVRFLTVYFWMKNAGEVDNVTVTKTPDPTMNFKPSAN